MPVAALSSPQAPTTSVLPSIATLVPNQSLVPVFDALVPIACHVYLVERHPDTIRYQRELDLAFGPDLPRLREMKRQWDPHGLLPSLEASVLRS